MQYILTEEEYNSLVPKIKLIATQNQLEAVVEAFRNTDLCVQHKYGSDAYCDNCPISSINISIIGSYSKVCTKQKFSK